MTTINKTVNSSIELGSKKELIEGFIGRVTAYNSVNDDWSEYVSDQKEINIIRIIEEENLKPKETRKLIEDSIRDGNLKNHRNRP